MEVIAAEDGLTAQRRERELEELKVKLEKLESDKLDLEQQLEVEKGMAEMRREREVEELKCRLEMELSRRAGRKMRDCLNFIEKSMTTQAYGRWLRCQKLNNDAGMRMKITLDGIVANYTRQAWFLWKVSDIYDAVHSVREQTRLAHEQEAGDLRKQLAESQEAQESDRLD